MISKKKKEKKEKKKKKLIITLMSTPIDNSPTACGGNVDELQTTSPTTLSATSGCPFHTQDTTEPASAENGGEGRAPSSMSELDKRQQAHPDQRAPLPTMRFTSSIPKAPKDAPPSSCPHIGPSPETPTSTTTEQPPTAATTEEHWIYPSPQMFYNAMKRKGKNPSEDDMRTVVKIHNAVNEQVWRNIMHWEKMHCDECATPKLKSFSGNYDKLSPKARYRMWVHGDKRPFDRHDWIIDRCGREVRYVIDFYEAPPTEGKQVGIHLDVRPAVDSFRAAYDRLRVFAGDYPRLVPGSEEQ